MPSDAQLETPYTLALLSEYTHTLDALPIDLSRNFADLRELDAVLSSSVTAITEKIRDLTTMIEEGKVSKQDKLWLLTEIAEEAQKLKLGGEDKIRVACQAADNLKGHSSHLRTLAEHVPSFDASVLNRKTVYPHVSERSYMPAATMEMGRRRRGALGGSIMTNQDPSPAKRKRVIKDDDIDISSRTPKKLGTEGNPRARNNGRAKKSDRVASPSESLVSVTSHPQQTNSGRGANATSNARAGNAASGGNKRARAGANNHRTSTPLANEVYPAHETNGHTNGSRRGAADAYSVLPSSSHPSLPQPYQNGNGAGHVANGYDAHGMAHNITGDWNIPSAQQLEGPGMPVARSASIHSTATNLPVGTNVVESTDAGDGDGDGDDRTYCFCDGISYGEMIACDDNSCEREWFHLACIGLTVPPDGTWYCDTCKNKKNSRRPVRGGKRRAGGGRSSGKS